jgi:hypothetical protein
VLSTVRQYRPHRERVISSVLEAALANETNVQRDQRAVLALAEKDAALQISKDEEECIEEQALHKEVDRQTTHPPLSGVEWRAHISKCLLPVVRYIISRFQTGDRADAVKFYRGDGVCDPLFVKSISMQQGRNLTDNVKYYTCLNKSDIRDGHKSSFKFMKEAADRVTATEVDVIQWRYKMGELMKKKAERDAYLYRCWECLQGIQVCNCGLEHFGLWWEACELATLVQPSSAAAERVFSMLNNMWADQQTSALSDIIKLSLYLRLNKRLE